MFLSPSFPLGTLCDVSVGDLTECVCSSGRLLKGEGLMLATPHGFGRLDITDVSDHYLKNPFSKLQKLTEPIRCVALQQFVSVHFCDDFWNMILLLALT